MSTDYVELHARSAFSWLRGGSAPEALAKEAARLQLPAVALCDRGGDTANHLDHVHINTY